MAATAVARKSKKGRGYTAMNRYDVLPWAIQESVNSMPWNELCHCVRNIMNPIHKNGHFFYTVKEYQTRLRERDRAKRAKRRKKELWNLST